jgi:hypothetical protein
MLILSGFGQMPIFKRYYIADIPGFGWLAQFYVTHLLHYFFAAVIIGTAFYVAFLFAVNLKNKVSLTIPALFASLSIGMLIISGFVMAVKNFNVHFFSENMIIFTDIIHVCFVMVLLVASAIGFFAKSGWTKVK